jgi:hypothetical protein
VTEHYQNAHENNKVCKLCLEDKSFAGYVQQLSLTQTGQSDLKERFLALATSLETYQSAKRFLNKPKDIGPGAAVPQAYKDAAKNAVAAAFAASNFASAGKYR